MQFWGLPVNEQGLEQALIRFGEYTTEAIKTITIAVAIALQETEHHSTLIELNDFLSRIGINPRSTKERRDWWRRLYEWLIIWDGVSIHGARSSEKYIHPITGKEIATTIRDPLIRIMGRRFGQESFDNSEPPLAVYIAPGAFLDKFRGTGALQ